MTDPHLNLFYSYNRDTELIENNLTRAFIVTLRLLSPDARDALLQELFNKPLLRLGGSLHSYQHAQMALQSNMDREHSQQIPFRYLITLASDRIVMAEEEGSDDQRLAHYLSIPDGWIYDQEAGYCFLIEAKVGSNPINDIQVRSHGSSWLGIDGEQLSDYLIPLTWIDVIQAIWYLKGNSIELSLNTQELTVLKELESFIGLYGYRIFSGFTWDSLLQPPNFIISRGLSGEVDWRQYSGLFPPPEFRIYHKD